VPGAVLLRRDGELARGGRPFAVPVRQEEVPERLLAADEHFRLRQHEVAEGVEVLALCILVEEGEIRQVGHEGHLGIVGEDLRHRAHALGAAEEADLPGRHGHVLEDASRLLDDDVGLDRVVVEDLRGVAQDDGRHDRQRVRAHGGDGGHVAGVAARAGRIGDVEAHHAGRRRRFRAVVDAVVLGLDGFAHGGVQRGAEGLRMTVRRSSRTPPAEREECCVCTDTASLFTRGPHLESRRIVVKAIPE
jgi:hypothetical protein